MPLGLVWLGQQVREKVIDEVGKRMEQAGAQAVSYARELVPIDTGATSASLGYYWSRQDMKLVLYAGTKYSIFLELGTSRRAATPFLRPALMMVGRVFGTSTSIQFETAPAKYQAGYKKQSSHLRRPNVIIGRRRNR